MNRKTIGLYGFICNWVTRIATDKKQHTFLHCYLFNSFSNGLINILILFGQDNINHPSQKLYYIMVSEHDLAKPFTGANCL